MNLFWVYHFANLAREKFTKRGVKFICPGRQKPSVRYWFTLLIRYKFRHGCSHTSVVPCRLNWILFFSWNVEILFYAQRRFTFCFTASFLWLYAYWNQETILCPYPAVTNVCIFFLLIFIPSIVLLKQGLLWSWQVLFQKCNFLVLQSIYLQQGLFCNTNKSLSHHHVNSTN